MYIGLHWTKKTIGAFVTKVKEGITQMFVVLDTKYVYAKKISLLILRYIM